MNTSLILSSILLTSALVENKPLESPKEAEQVVEQFFSQVPELPRYREAGYSPLGRSPMVDAFLADPLCMPTYAEQVTAAIQQLAPTEGLFALEKRLWSEAAIPISIEKPSWSSPSTFSDAFPQEISPLLQQYWSLFLKTSQEVEAALSALTDSEKNWLLLNYNRFFFGDSEKELKYQFFTTVSAYPIQFYALAAKVDLAKLAGASLKLAFICDHFNENRSLFANLPANKSWTVETDGKKLIVSTKTGVKHEEEADFFIDLGGSNQVENNAGGTLGMRPLALHLDLKGNNHYTGTRFCQGTGFLGVGGFYSCAGHNTFQAESYSQGTGYFGSGFLVNRDGHNQFILDYAGQSLGLFGSALLLNLQGNNQYTATQGMAQSASSTLGTAFLIDLQGSNVYNCGGIGQGGSTGVRNYPWLNNPSFYGGLSYLYTGGGSNRFKNSWICQGSAYFMGAGILVSEGSNNHFEADYDGQGQGLHLAAGLLLSKGDNNSFKGGWGSLGVGGDRSVGILISKGSHNQFEGTEQSTGSSRKPKAVGLFFSIGDHNQYTFRKESCASIQLPESPNEWSSALFLEQGSQGIYSQDVDRFIRGSGRIWGVPGHSKGLSSPDSFKIPFHDRPQIFIAPFRPLEQNLEALAQEIPTADDGRRRQIYETLDFQRFQNRKHDPDLSFLLNDPSALPEDAFTYAVLWALRNKEKTNLDALKNSHFASPYARKMAVSLIGTYWKPESTPYLLDILQDDPSDEVRYYAALSLAIHLPDSSLDQLKPAIANSSEIVRYAIARGLQETGKPSALPLIKPLLQDTSFYVRRAAGMTALSLGDKEGIDAVMETLSFETLDTTDNYGDNIFRQLAEYLGVDFGLDKQVWIRWWKENKDQFQFPKEPLNK